MFDFFKMGFTPCKAEQPLWGMELQEKKHKKITAYRKLLHGFLLSSSNEENKTFRVISTKQPLILDNLLFFNNEDNSFFFSVTLWKKLCLSNLC